MARLSYLHDATPDAPIDCTIITGPRHGEVVRLNPDRHYYRVAEPAAMDSCYQYGFEVGVGHAKLLTHRRYDMVVGSIIHHLLIPEKWIESGEIHIIECLFAALLKMKERSR